TGENITVIGPNNGIFTLISTKYEIKEIYTVSNQRFYYKGKNGQRKISQTFHGRDIMAPVAAYLSGGVPIENIGKKLNIDDLTINKELLGPKIEKNNLVRFMIIYTDRFGNLVTNIEKKEILHLLKNDKKEFYFITGTHDKIQISFKENFAEIPDNQFGFITGSSGFMEICKKKDSAAEFLGSKSGDIMELLIN
ncbi:MAG: SAM hydrolase/SAM-dependent halogenase family protein, partial [Promethearchaeota archaeon]